MLAVEGVVETTGGRRVQGGESWTSPPGVEHGLHLAVTDVEFITISLGAEGTVIVESPAVTQQQATGSAAPGGRFSVSAGAVRGKGIDRRPQALVVKAAGRAAA
jgi:hypothetical protein